MRTISKELQHQQYSHSRAPIATAQSLQLQVSPPRIADFDLRLQHMESFMQLSQGGGARACAGLQILPVHASRQLQLFRPHQPQGQTTQPVPQCHEAGSPGLQLAQLAPQHEWESTSCASASPGTTARRESA